MHVRILFLVLFCGSVCLRAQAAIQPRIKNIVFDIGKVILFNRYHTIKNTTPDQRKIFKTIRVSPERKSWFEGHINAQELIERLSRTFNRADVEAAVNKELASREFIPQTVSVINELKKQGYKLFILSNTSREVYDTFIVSDDFFRQFDGMLFSFDAQALKPGAQIYRCLLEKFNLKPHESVFIDDKESNVVAARKLGMVGIVFQPDTIAAELAELEVL